MTSASALRYELLATCKTSRARASLLHLPHQSVSLPVFMPVGTQGTMKGVTTAQLKDLGCEILLGNTYHLGHRPGPELLIDQGGLHAFMNWDRAILTDSGGFQMVSLLSLAEISETGVAFTSPHDSSQMMLTPEESMRLQNAIGADIMMQLDDVTAPLSSEARLNEASERSVRWLDRCVAAHARPLEQNLFAILQGGLDLERRQACLDGMIARDTPGYAIGGLGGGEDKDSFCRIIKYCTERLPSNKPIYCMGIGYDTDLVVCIALGVDMFDCVFPTRTARFGHALVASGDLSLKQKQYAYDFRPIDATCSCLTCRSGISRALLHAIVTKETVGCHYISIHNLNYQLTLMRNARQSILEHRFPEWVRQWMKTRYQHDAAVPGWVQRALASVHISLD